MSDVTAWLAGNIKAILTLLLLVGLAVCVADRWRTGEQDPGQRSLDLLTLGLLAVYAVLLIALGVQHTGLTDYSVEWDFPGQMLRAQDLSQVFTANPRSPFGYPLLLWSATHLAGDAFAGAKIVAGFSTLLVLRLTYVLGRRLFRPYVALLAVLALVTTPVFAGHSLLVGTDMPALALLLGSIWLLFTSAGERWWLVAAAGVLGGMSALLRLPALVLIPAVILWLFGLRWGPEESKWSGHRLRTSAIYSLAFFATVLPYVILNTAQTGNPLYSDRATDVWLELYGGWDFGQLSDLGGITLWQIISIDPPYFVAHWGENVLETLSTSPLGWPLALFAVPGILALPWKSKRPELGLLYWFGVGFLAATAVAWSTENLPRIFLPLVPFLVLIAVWLFCYLNPFDLHIGRLRLPWRESLFFLFLMLMLWSEPYYIGFLQPGAQRQHSYDRPDVEHPLNIDLENRAHLLGYSLSPVQVRPGEVVQLTLYWQAGYLSGNDYTVFTHVIDTDGQMWAGQDNWPQGGSYRTSLWTAGEFVTDVYDLAIPDDIAPGEYQIEVGMYLLETMERLEAIGEAGQAAGDSAVFPGFWVQSP